MKEKSYITLFSDTRASSEAVSHAILFVLIITLVTGVSVAGDRVIEQTQEGQALDQGVSGFVEMHEVSKSYNDIGSQNQFATAPKSVEIRAINAEFSNQDETIITAERDSTGETYSISTTPFTVSHDRFDLYYDGGVVSSVELQEDRRTTHWIPPANHQADNAVIRFTTTQTNGDIQESDTIARVLIEQAAPAETFTLDNGDTITVETDTPHGWAEYLGTYEYLEVTDTGDGEVEASVDIGDGNQLTIHNQQVEVSSL